MCFEAVIWGLVLGFWKFGFGVEVLDGMVIEKEKEGEIGMGGRLK